MRGERPQPNRPRSLHLQNGDIFCENDGNDQRHPWLETPFLREKCLCTNCKKNNWEFTDSKPSQCGLGIPLTCGYDLVRRQQEAVLPSIPQLNQVRVLDGGRALCPVRRSSRESVWKQRFKVRTRQHNTALCTG